MIGGGRMIGAEELVRRFAELDRAELARWIERRWIVPEARPVEGGRGNGAEGDAETWLFHEVDIARVELILDIRREFTADEETLSLVLGLLDQVYSLRRQLRRLCGAIENQPGEIRDAIRRALSAAAAGER
jgi:chaperone modulatory protein CbpM